ncbi:MAG: Fe-S cluster assembly protein SufD [FCB group bacterium]|nr:Fe-S cluster assembly protein SufD [FCB group bacterium]
MTTKKSYTADFRSFLGKDPEEPEFVRDLRQVAFSRFTELGFPTTRREDWRFTSVSDIAKTRFILPNGQLKTLRKAEIHSRFLDDTYRIVVCNGRYNSELSDLAGVSGKIAVAPLSAALRENQPEVRTYFGKWANFREQAFTALNTAFFRDGIYLHVKPKTIIEKPLHVMYVANPGNENTVFHQRNLFRIGPNSQVTIIEHYLSLSDVPYFTNTVTEIVAEDNSVLNHIRIQDEAQTAYHISGLYLHQNRDSRTSGHHFTIGSRLTRNDVHIFLDGAGCDCLLNGLSLTRGKQHVDHHTTIDHRQPNGNSRECFKNILAGRARGVFNGLVIVRPEAQKTNASQSNKNLLLSENAVMYSNPQLEINAEDVKCSHGSTTGELDEEVLFYLRSRGLDPIAAQALLITGFANEIIEQIPDRRVGKMLSEKVNTWLKETGENS